MAVDNRNRTLQYQLFLLRRALHRVTGKATPFLPDPPEPAGMIDDPRTFTDDTLGSGIFGKWIVDDDGLPAYEYTLDQHNDLRAAYPNTEAVDRRDHWHQIGNNRITGLAYNDGVMQVYSADRGGMFLNFFEPDTRVSYLGILLAIWRILWKALPNWWRGRGLNDTQREYRAPTTAAQLRAAINTRKARSEKPVHAYTGGYAYLDDGEETWATAYRYRPAEAETRRIFGMGYKETQMDYRKVRVTRRVYAPAGNIPALVVDVTLENRSRDPKTLRYYEYWDVNVHQLVLQWVRTGVFGPVGDALRRQVNKWFTPDMTYSADSHMLCFQQTLIESAPDRNAVDKVNWYPAPVFLADLSGTPDAYYTNKSAFFGEGDAAQPITVRQRLESEPTPLDDSPMPYCMVLRRTITLQPGEQRTLRFAYGTAETDGSFDFLDELQAENLALTLADDWKTRLAYFSTGTAPYIQREMAWHAYSLLSSTVYNEFFNLNIVPQGSAYLYLHGADGAPRDHALFVLALTYIEPALAKDLLRLMMRLTYASDGRISYAYAGVGYADGAGIHNDPSDLDLFFLMAMTEYLAATGDTAFLEESVPFYPPDAQQPDDTSVLAHIRVALEHLMNGIGLGEHGLIRITDGDWSDGVVVENVLRQPLRISFGNTLARGESIPNSQMALYVLPRIARLLEAHDPTITETVRKWILPLKEAVQKQWTGQYYARAILRDHLDNPYVLNDSIIDLEAQPWSLISGLAAEQGVESTLIETIEQQLDATSPTGTPLMKDAMVWPAISQLLTWGYRRNRPDLAWRSFFRNLFVTHTEIFAETWIHIWSGPDGTNSLKLKDNPGGAWASAVTPVTDFPVMNNNPHAMALIGMLRVCGIEPTEQGDGLVIAPAVPNRYRLDVRLLGLDVRPGRIAGEYRPVANSTRKLYIAVPENAANIRASVAGNAVTPTVSHHTVVLVLTCQLGQPIPFEVAWD